MNIARKKFEVHNSDEQDHLASSPIKHAIINPMKSGKCVTIELLYTSCINVYVYYISTKLFLSTDAALPTAKNQKINWIFY